MEKKSYTRKQIAQRIIENEDLLIIYSNKIYRLNSWIKHHPGGDMVILHMIGKVRLVRKLKFEENNFFSGCNG
jgi:cytochrome b involved in lipid metabolism